MDSAKTVRLYRRVGKEGSSLVVSMHKTLERMLGQVFHEYHRSGGQSGDLGQEVANLTLYSDGESTLQLYVVSDDNTNGFSICISVIGELRGAQGEEAMSFLRACDLVSSHSSFKERTPGFHAFADYLEELYTIPRNGPFAVR